MLCPFYVQMCGYANEKLNMWALRYCQFLLVVGL